MSTAPTAHIDRTILKRLPPPYLRPRKVYSLPGLAPPARVNAASVLLSQGERHAGADAVALSATAVRWSWSELAVHVRAVSTALRAEFGLVPGNRVLLYAPNTPTLVAALLGVLEAGCIAVPALPLLRERELAPMIAAARPSLALCHGARHPVPAGLFASTIDELVERGMAAKTPLEPVETAAQDPALILFTSGTTSGPKAVVHTHGDLLALVAGFGRHVFCAGPADIVVGSPSLAFAYGLGCLLAAPLAAGAQLHLLERGSPESLLAAADEMQATLMVTAPTAFRKLLSAATLAPLSCLRRCFSAGEPLPSEVAGEWRARTGAPIVDLLGSTEMLGPYVAGSDDAPRQGTIGRAVPGYELRLVEPSAEGAGRLAVRGPTGGVCLDAATQARAVRDGWTLTGDLCRLDAEGYVSFIGRADDLIVSAGYNIPAVEVERVLASHPAVRECAVTGISDAERGRAVVALVVPAQAPDVALAELLIAHVKRELAPYKAPREIRFAEGLPRTATGKIRRAALGERFRMLAAPARGSEGR